MAVDDHGRVAACCDDFSELLCVTFHVSFHIDADIRVVALECLGPCPPKATGTS